MIVAVTGASGHVGINLIKKLLTHEYKIRVLIHNNNKLHLENSVEYYYGDLTKKNTLTDFCKGADVIIHLAAKISIGSNSKQQIYKTNVIGTQNLAEVAKDNGIKRFIHFSSIHALKNEPLDEKMDESRGFAKDSPIDYERTKAIADEWILGQNSENFNVIVLNPTSIIGPADYGPSLMGQFMCNSYKGYIPGVVNGGYNWVDVRDIVDATIKAIKKGKPGNRYILSGEWVNLKDFSDSFFSFSDLNKKMLVIPLWMAYMGIPFLKIFAQLTKTTPLYTKQSLSILQSGNKKISSDKAKKELDFKTRPLEETLKDSYNWFKENNYI